MTIGKRLRFEILKRDGFKCRYCGALSITTILHVDHVVPRAEGGNDDPANLIAACAECNLGKSDVPLEESRIVAGPTAEDALEHAEQIRAYLAAHAERAQAIDDVEQFVLEQYEAVLGQMEPGLWKRLPSVVRTHSLDEIATAIQVTRARRSLEGKRAKAMYFSGVLRRFRERRAGGAQ